MKKNLFGFLILALLTSCSGTKEIRGALIYENDINQLRAGIQDKKQVLQILGSPSNKATLDDDKWIYVTDYTVTKPLKKTEVEKRHVLVLEFKENMLDKITQLDESSSKTFKPDPRITKTYGDKLGFFEQIYLNITSGF